MTKVCVCSLRRRYLVRVCRVRASVRVRVRADQSVRVLRVRTRVSTRVRARAKARVRVSGGRSGRAHLSKDPVRFMMPKRL